MGKSYIRSSYMHIFFVIHACFLRPTYIFSSSYLRRTCAFCFHAAHHLCILPYSSYLHLTCMFFFVLTCFPHHTFLVPTCFLHPRMRPPRNAGLNSESTCITYALPMPHEVSSRSPLHCWCSKTTVNISIRGLSDSCLGASA